VRGRRPLPSQVKRARGNPGKRALPRLEVQPPAGVPECPPQVTGHARAEWDRIVPELLAAGLLTKLDRAALVGYCIAWGQWSEALDALRTHGTLVKSPSGYPMQSPYVAISNKAFEQWTRMLTEFGMSPSSRSRVNAAPQVSELRVEHRVAGMSDHELRAIIATKLGADNVAALAAHLDKRKKQ
jgi:P27 family predicted phage terminase small subunit